MTQFQQFISNLEHGKYRPFRDAVLQRLTPRISEQTFRNWERGIYEPDETRRQDIDAIAIEMTGAPVYPDNETKQQ